MRNLVLNEHLKDCITETSCSVEEKPMSFVILSPNWCQLSSWKFHKVCVEIEYENLSLFSFVIYITFKLYGIGTGCVFKSCFKMSSFISLGTALLLRPR